MELTDIREAVASGDFVSASQMQKLVSLPAGRRRLALAVGLLAIGIATWLYFFAGASPPVDLPRVVPLTTHPAREGDPALSPDGKQVAFTRDVEGQSDIYVRLVDGGADIRLTETPLSEYSLVWSPDGGRIAFLREIREAGYCEVLVIPALGGSERRLTTIDVVGEGAPLFYSGLDWSPDGRFLAFADKTNPEEREGIFLLDIETGGKKAADLPSGPKNQFEIGRPLFLPMGGRSRSLGGANLYGFEVHLAPIEWGRDAASQGR